MSGQLAKVADPYEARIAAAESRLATLTREIAAVEAERAAIAESLASARSSIGAQQPADREPAPADYRRTLDVGRFRVTFGGPYGARVDSGSVHEVGAPVPPAVPPATGPTVSTLRADAQDAVWDAFSRGARVVSVVGEPGAGATTLLRALASDACLHGFAQAFCLADSHGPAVDVAQRLAARYAATDPPRYYLDGELRRIFTGSQLLVLLDRADLSAQEQAELADLLPDLRFVIVNRLALRAPFTVELGPLDAEHVLDVLQAGFGRVIDPAEHETAIALCATVGALPGPSRLIGVAAGELGRSFASLGTDFPTGTAIAGALIAALSPTEQRILAIVRLVPAVLSADRVAAVVGSGEVSGSLERLCDCELLRLTDNRYELPRWIQPLVPALVDNDAVYERVIGVLCAALDATPADRLADAQVCAAEAIVQTAFERFAWPQVLALGPRLAQILAMRGAFGAWGRVLNLVAAAANRVDDAAALGLARHELGVRSLLLGEYHKSSSYLRSAAQARERALDHAGASASTDLLALVQAIRPEPEVARNDVSTSEPRAYRNRRPRAAVRRTGQRWILFALAFCVTAALGAWLAIRPAPAPAITAFSADRPSIAAGSTAQLCVTATAAALVTITPDVGPLRAQGKQCVAVMPAATTTYTAVVTGLDNREAHQAVTVTVRKDAKDAGPRPLTIDAFFFRPARITAGKSARLCYAVTGAQVLRTVPSIGRLEELHACRSVTPGAPRRVIYKLVAIGDNGQIAIRRARIDVVAARPAAAVVVPPTALRSRSTPPTVSPNHRDPDARLARRAVYQFDATPSVVERGQTASLCVGIGRWATGEVTGIGTLSPGITRCYRVHPSSTTTYRLRVALDDSVARETLTVAVRDRPHQVAHTEHH